MTFSMKDAIAAFKDFINTNMGPESAAPIKFSKPVISVGNPLIMGAITGRVNRIREYPQLTEIGKYTDHFLISLDINIEGLSEESIWDTLDDLVDAVKVLIQRYPKIGEFFYDTECLGTQWAGAQSKDERGGFLAIAAINFDLMKKRNSDSVD